MRFPSRLISSAQPSGRSAFALAVVVAALASGAGCEDKHIGRPCELGASAADAGPVDGGDHLAGARVPEPNLHSARRRKGPRGHERALHRRCTTDDDCRRREAASATDTAAALQERLRLHVADDGRPVLLPEDVRLPRLRDRAEGRIPDPAGLHEPSGRRLSERAMSVGPRPAPTGPLRNAWGPRPAPTGPLQSLGRLPRGLSPRFRRLTRSLRSL